MKLIVSAGLGLSLAIGAAWGSRAIWHPRGADRALLRMALRARPERIEQCRRMTDEELAGVPAHMRERIQCTGHTARYRLSIAVDGVIVADRQIGGGGARSDRPVSLLEDFPLRPGQRAVAVRIVRLDSAATIALAPDDSSTSERERRMAETRERARREALPSIVVLDTTITVDPGQVVLVSYDPDRRRFTLPFSGGTR